MEKPNFYVGLAQLVVGLLLWLHIEPSWIGQSLHMTRDTWMLFFICGGFAFTGLGLYRTYRPRVSTKNIENKVNEWLLAVHLVPTEHDFKPWHFTCVIMFRGYRIFVGRP